MKKLFLTSQILLLLFCNNLYSYSPPAEACSYSGANQINTNSLIINPIPYRSQWNENDGYCGETSILSAGLYFGEYISQYDARVLANINFPAKIMQLNQILIGSPGGKVENNIAYAANNMHLNYQMYNNLPLPGPSSVNFLTWVKGMVIQHYPTIIGVYENASVFAQPSPDPEYDHIVPVFGVESSFPLNETPVTYHANDKIFLHDHELYTYTGTPNVGCYQYQVDNFQKSRSAANQPLSGSVGVYSVSNNSNGHGNFGIAITGVKGDGLLPVSIQTTPNLEDPEIPNQNTRPTPQLITLNIQVSNLVPNKLYILLKYNNFNALPANDDFTKSHGNPVAKCSIEISSGTTFSKQETIYSNTMAIYRAVLAHNQGILPPAC